MGWRGDPARGSIDVAPFVVGDVTVHVSTNRADFAAVADAVFHDLRRPGPIRRSTRFEVLHTVHPWPRWGAWRDGRPLETNLSESYVLFHLQWELNQVFIEDSSPCLHAAAVERFGRGVVIGGVSGSGKSTLAAYLSSQGFGLLCDELVGVDGDRTIDRYPRPLGLRHGGPLAPDRSFEAMLGGFGGYEMLVPVSRVGGRVSSGSRVPIDLVVLPYVDPGSEFSVRSVEASTAMLRLADGAPGLQGPGASQFFERVEELVRAVPVVEINTVDLAAARRTIQTHLGIS